jgi:hypothetical protein
MAAITTLLAVVLLSTVLALAWDAELSSPFAKQTAAEMKRDPMRIADRIDMGAVARIDVWCWCGLATLSSHRLCEVVTYGPPLPALTRHLPLNVTSQLIKEPIRALSYTALTAIIDSRLYLATRGFRDSCRVVQNLVRDDYPSLFYHAADVWLELRRWRCPLSQ